VTEFRTAIAPPVADVIRHLPPDVKRSVKLAIRALSADPVCGEPLQRELDGYWKYRVRRFRIVYSIDRSHRIVRIVAVGHRRRIYEEAAEQLHRQA
jgi:mRNA interferase RelE/StbE